MNWGMNAAWNYETNRREYSRGVVTIYEFERGLLYRGGRLEKVLEAGRHRIWPFSHAKIEVVDVRRASAQIVNQKLLTSDQITVTLNMVADYKIVDVANAVHKVANYQTQLYEETQLAARNIVGAVTVDALLENRLAINAQLLESVAPLAAEYGLRVLAVAIKDVILAPEVRDLLMKEVEAKRVASAMLIGAREEVAAMRALANAARMAEENPALLRLRELEVARSLASNSGNTLVMGLDASTPLARKANGKTSEVITRPEIEVE